jgi:predicted outer membrane repeat protein
LLNRVALASPPLLLFSFRSITRFESNSASADGGAVAIDQFRGLANILYFGGCVSEQSTCLINLPRDKRQCHHRLQIKCVVQSEHGLRRRWRHQFQAEQLLEREHHIRKAWLAVFARFSQCA